MESRQERRLLSLIDHEFKAQHTKGKIYVIAVSQRLLMGNAGARK
jgi:hypothetical protein